MNREIKIILVDDHDLVLEGFKMLLMPHTQFRVIGEANNGKELRSLLTSVQPDVIVMDIKMPGESGIELCKFVKINYPDIKVAFVTANVEEHYINAAINAGATAFISKTSAIDDLVDAIRQSASGNEYFSKEISSKMLKMYSYRLKNKASGEKPLSEREIEVIEKIADGKDFISIGAELNISPRTVETHKKNILEKLHLSNTAELIKFAIRNNITEL